jgi:hypothetical protein
MSDVPHEIDLNTVPLKWHHEYYFTHDGKFDLAKIRGTCEIARRGDTYNKPSSSIIHFHRFTQDCDPSLTDHEEYVPE